MHSEVRSLNIRYSLIHLFYWIIYGTLISFASAYLLDRGLSNSMIGVILAFGNICPVVLQPVLATFMDCHPNVSLKNFLAGMFLISMALSLVIQYVALPTAVLMVLMIVILGIYLSATPLITTLAFRLEYDGLAINFGVARGIGSFVYAIACIILGAMVQRFGTGFLRISEAGLYVCLIVLLLTFREPSAKAMEALKNRQPSNNRNGSLIAFFQRYRAFSLFVFSSILVFFAHSLVAYFMLQVLEPIGGDSASLGNACSIGAFSESIVMILYARINRKFSSYHLLRLTALMFAVKQIITALAGSVPVFYFSQSLQFLGYGLFIPASAAYVSRLMRDGDLTRGQTMATVAPAIGNVFASFAGGILLDHVGVPGLLTVSVAASVVGAACMLVISASKSMNIPSLAQR